MDAEKLIPGYWRVGSYTFLYWGKEGSGEAAEKESGGLYDKWIIHFLPPSSVSTAEAAAASYRNDDNEDVVLQLERSFVELSSLVVHKMRKAVFGMLVLVKAASTAFEAGALFHLVKREAGRRSRAKTLSINDGLSLGGCSYNKPYVFPF